MNSARSPIQEKSMKTPDESHSVHSPQQTRRDFLKRATAVTAAAGAVNPLITPVYGQNQAPSPGRVIGANDRIVVAFVGVGNQGMAHVTSIKKNAADNNIV